MKIVPLLSFSLLLCGSLTATKEQAKKDRAFRTVCYKVSAVSGIASFIGGSASAWLFYFIQSRRE